MVAPESVRARLVGRLVAGGRISTPAVEGAFRTVPRHVFLPGLPAERAYADEAVPIKWQDGVAISSVSQPSMMAIMLEQLDLRPAQRVLEIGAGSGYNAALIARIVGPSGLVVSIDIDQDLVDSAAAHLTAAGVDGVQLACADGAGGFPAAAPYDRIVLTVGSGDIQPSWVEQLAPAGRLLLPLSIRGSQLSIALDLMAGSPPWLCSCSVSGCAFIRLRGAGAGPARTRAIGPDGLLVRGSDDREIDIDGLLGVLRRPGADRPSGVRLSAADLWDGFGLWLSVADADACRLLVSGPAAELLPGLGPGGDGDGTLSLLDRTGVAALVRGGIGAHGTSSRWPLPAVIRPFGPGGDRLADRLVEHLHRWRSAGRPRAGRLRVRVYPRGTQAIEPDDLAGAIAIETRHSCLLLDWPS